MKIEFINPFSKAWERMKKALFRPFDIGKWFAMGFTVFLANLLNGGGGGGGGNFSGANEDGNAVNIPDLGNLFEKAADWIHAHPFIMVGIMIGIFIGIGIVLIITWLSSRGTFMFLDNVVHDRALIVKPWRRYKSLANSLFLWRIGFGMVSLLLMLPFLLLVFFQIVQYSHDPSAPLNIQGLVILGLSVLVLSVMIAYISLFTRSFIVPIMYRHDLRILQAWQKFLSIFKSHFIQFFLYGLFILLLYIGIGIAVLLAGCFTCCIGFVLLALPYISSVLLLPVYFTLRAFSLEFLAQWGSDYSVFPKEPL